MKFEPGKFYTEPTFTLKEDILKLHILYLEKVDNLSKGEREVFEKYFNHLNNPLIISEINLND